MKRISIIGATLIATVAQVAGCSAASASIWIATYTGKVYNSYDMTGLFGAANSSLDGAAFISRYRYDTSIGTRSTLADVYDFLEGGGYSPSAITGTLTINGITRTVLANLLSKAQAAPGSAYHRVQNYYPLGDGVAIQAILNTGFPVGSTANLEMTVPLTTNVGGSGSFRFDRFGTYGTVISTSGSFSNETFQLSAAVPEPSSWALMIAGFGIAGAGLRYRRRDAASSVRAQTT